MPAESETVLEIPSELLLQGHRHAEDTYPEECCGLLLGTANPPQRLATRFERAQNAAPASRRSRYVIAPECVAAALHRASLEDLCLLGFYHSHPDGPSRPSEVDREAAWPGASYLIYSVEDGSVVDARSWRLTNAVSGFEEETLLVKDDPARSAPRREEDAQW